MKWRLYSALFLIFASCSEGIETIETSQHFKKPKSSKTGITFSNDLTENDTLSILDYLYFYNGGGTAIIDVNNDGLQDIYLSGNQVKNKLYLNKGNLQFEDITTKAGVAGSSSWNTGTIVFDANQDGLLDIYVCAVVGINGFKGHNELFINNGDSTFTERAKEFGLDFQNYSTTAATLDFDNDGDLDIYLLNHAIHTEESYGKAALRLKRNEKSSDKILRNDGGNFVDVSEEMGLIGGITSYGLGVSVADFNQDGWPDIYVGNDFHEDDYYYINEAGKRFRESLKENFSHTSRFSMGNDAADLNHDGYPDIISLDMAPEEETVLKSSEGDDNIQTQKLRIESYGYHYQFTRNMLFINQPGYQFREEALSSGIGSTDWSWSPLFADFDNDGYQDLFISNGIPKRPNDLDFINFVSSKEIKNKVSTTRLIDNSALAMMPSGKIANYIFQGGKDLTFRNRSDEWLDSKPSASGATAIADFDNDGDLDIITNNSNEPATLYVNKKGSKNKWLQIHFRYKKNNPFGIGTKAYAYINGNLQYKELYTSRGFQASSEPVIHFGMGKTDQLDSLKIVWPDNTFQVLKNVKSNQRLVVTPKNTLLTTYLDRTERPSLFSKVPGNLAINYVHKEDTYVDFNRQKLIPFKISDRGPATAIADLNGDGTDDIYFGSSKFITSEIYIQKDSAFTKSYTNTLQSLAKTEDVTATFFNKQLAVGTAGGDFSIHNAASEDYILEFADSLTAKMLSIRGNASVVIPNDYDRDGDIDLFIGHHAVTGDYGKIPTSYLLKNDNETFIIDTKSDVSDTGMVTDAIWSDFTGDGLDDLIVIGEWMTVQFYKNTNGVLKRIKVQPERLKGLWQAIEPFDIDKDGDTDYMLGNWGTNSKFVASLERPLKMYYADFDKNGQTETIVAVHKKGKYYPLQGLGELSGQLVNLKKKYPNNKSFAGQSISEIFGKYALENTDLLEVHTLSSGYLKNENGIFTFVPFDPVMQVAPILDFCKADFDNNGEKEVLAAGNYFGVKPYHGRLDSFPGALIKNEKQFILGYEVGLDFAQKSVRHLNILTIDTKEYLLVTFNNDKAQVYNINK